MMYTIDELIELIKSYVDRLIEIIKSIIALGE